MILIILSLIAIAALLVTTEVMWRFSWLEPETARKIIHIAVGSFIAFWPLFMSWRTIQILSAALFVGVFLSYELGVFGAIHHVKRKTSGELWFPIGIGLTALLTSQPWIFTIAILHLSLADGVAALVGGKWGYKHYQIGQHTRSLTGSLAFLFVSFGMCMAAFVFLKNELPGISLGVFAVIPFLATSAESISRHGWDNIFVPLAVLFALGLPTGMIVLNI